MPLGLAQSNAYIATPASLVSCSLRHMTRTSGHSGRSNQTELVRKLNKSIIAQARRFVWGMTDLQLAFIKRNFGTAPDRVIITPEQRAEAIAAER